MHAHSTSSVSHSGSFLKTVGGVRVDCELVSSGWQLSERCEDRGPQHGGGSTEPGAGEGRKEGAVGGFFCRVGCRGVKLRAGRVGGMWVGKESVEGRVGEGRGELLLSLRACCVGCAVGFWLHVLVCREVSEERC